MRVALTGASGFVGTPLLACLLDSGYAVTALVHRTPLAPRDRLRQIQGRLDDPAALTALCDGADTVIHLAGVVAATHPAQFHAINAEGTRRLAEAAHGAGVGRLLLISSLAARAPDLSAYAASKAAAETKLAEAAAQGPAPAWDALRPPAVYGPGDAQILPFFRLLRHGLALVPAPPEARLSLIHVGDLVAAIAAWTARARPAGTVYEVADGRSEGYTWPDLIAAGARVLAAKPRRVVPPAGVLRGATWTLWLGARLRGRSAFLSPDKLREIRHPDWVCHDRRIEQALAWRPRWGLEDGLRDTLDWYRAQGWL